MQVDKPNPQLEKTGRRAVRRIVLRQRLIMTGVLLAVILMYFADARGWLLTRRNDDLASYHGVDASVTRIIDGDTFEIDLPDALSQTPATRIRLWGINAPEPASGNREAQPFAREAADFVQARIKSDRVTLWLEAHRTRDPFGSVLAHIELPDGTHLNQEILDAGLARTDERWPHALLTRYAQLENSARRRVIGIWSIKPQRPSAGEHQ